MAIATPCQTANANYHITIGIHAVSCMVEFYDNELDLTTQEASVLEANIHNAVELALAPYFKK